VKPRSSKGESHVAALGADTRFPGGEPAIARGGPVEGRVSTMRRLGFTIDSKRSLVGPLLARVRNACATMKIATMDAALVEICVVEAVNHAIDHAYDDETWGTIDVVLTLRDHDLVVDIRDSGAPLPKARLLSPRVLRDPSLLEFDALPERGMGLSVLYEMMDEVSYESAHGINLLRLRKRIALSPELASRRAP
jgi:serine/threonine-protein kinase RsbW